MKKRQYIIGMALGVCIMLFSGCQELEEPINKVPKVTTNETVAGLGAHGASLSGSVTNNSYADEYYFLVSTSPNMNDARKYSAEWGDGGLYAHAYELERNTTYYYVLCAKYGEYEIRGQVESFTTTDSILKMGNVTLTSWNGENENLKAEEIGSCIITGDQRYESYWNKRISYNGSSWQLPYEMEIPSSSTLTMYAYAPYTGELLYENYNNIRVWVATYKYNGIDYLYGSSSSINDKNTTANITMKHALAKVVFQVQKGESNTKEDVVTELILNEKEGAKILPTSGYLNIVTGKINPNSYSYSEPLRWSTQVNIDKEKPKNLEVLTLPTTGPGDLSLSLRMSDEHTYRAYIPTDGWKAGTQYTYPVIVNETELVIGEVKVEQWQNTNSGDITVND